jgi:hypothetical protein
MADPARPEVKVDAKASSTVQVDHVDRQTPPPFGTGPVAADLFVAPGRKGLGSWVVALTIKQNLDNALAAIRAAGGVATSSGGIRDLGAGVNNTRSGTSFHYTGRAVDLYIYSGMFDPNTDPYVVTADPDVGTWRLFARTTDTTVAPLTLTAQKMVRIKTPKDKDGKDKEGADFCVLKEVEVTGQFFDLTDVFQKNGFKRIPAKPAFTNDPKARQYGAAEWWHFQDETGLVVGTTTYGSLLLQVHTSAELKGTAPFASKDAIWNGSIFH